MATLDSRLRRALTRLVVLTVASLAVGGAAHAGELADLHARLAAGRAAQAPRVDQPLPPGVRPLQPLPTARPEEDTTGFTAIGLERSACRGTCAAFTVVFQPDGTFRYEGVANVERLGDHTGTVRAGDLELLFRYVAAIGFLGLEDDYVSGYADVQTSYTYVERAGVEKVVRDEGNSAPATVWALELLIERLLEGAVWDD